MKAAKYQALGGGKAAEERERERLLGERQKIIARLRELDQQQIASYIISPLLDFPEGRGAFL